jgi:hypothetical protein
MKEGPSGQAGAFKETCLHDRFGGDIAGSTRPVLNDELLA